VLWRTEVCGADRGWTAPGPGGRVLAAQRLQGHREEDLCSWVGSSARHTAEKRTGTVVVVVVVVVVTVVRFGRSEVRKGRKGPKPNSAHPQL